jgi:O-antigen/teichoic acid export membrane protein
MDSELRDAAVSGVRWMAGARVISDALQFIAAVALARLIAPAEFGNAAVAMIFVPLSVIVTYEGFGSALVQRKLVDAPHLEAATLVSGVAGVVLTVITFLLAPVVAAPILSQEISDLIQLVSPVFAMAGVGTVSRALLSRDLDFRKIGLIETIGLVVGAFAAVGFAMAGLNAEAIVLGGLVSTAIASVLLVLAARPSRPR